MKAHFFMSVALAIVCANGEAKSGKAKAAFRTTHVTLYDCGLAQLEKQTEVNGAARLGIPVTLAHLDDLLASLVVAAQGSVRVTSVEYPSVHNQGQAIEASGMANALADESGALTAPEHVSGYLEALVGMSVSVARKSGPRAEGVVLDCVDDRPERRGEGATFDGATVPRALSPQRTLILVSQKGGLLWIPVDDIASIAPASSREASAVSDFATQLGKSNGFAETAVEIETAAGSKGRLAASFIRQIPLWRTVYKVIVGEKGVTVEAWAIVHNDTNEDWKGVEMTLVSGLPRSYVLSVASPRYRHRDTLILEGDGDMMPQLGAMTADSILYGIARPIVGESYGFGAGGLGGSGASFSVAGAGGVVSVGGLEASSSLLEVGDLAAQEQATAAVEGEISTYRALNAVSIPARTSSLVPLIRRELEGGAFTLVEQGSAPSTCVRVENETGLVLQDGIASVYIGGRFRGQEEIPRTEPGGVGVWCFGEDPDVEFSRTESVTQTNKALEWRDGALWSHNLKRTAFAYSLENRAGLPREIALDIRHIPNGRIVAPKSIVDADLEGRKLHLFEVPAQGKAEVEVVVEEGVMTPVSVERSELAKMSREESLPAAQREALAKAIGLMDERTRLERAVADEERAKAKDDERLAALREDLAAVPAMRSRSRMVERLLERVMEAEGRSSARGDAIEKSRSSLSKAQDALRALLERLRSGDVKL